MLYPGMPTLIEHQTPAESAALCRELGLDFVELNMNLPMYQPDRLDADFFRLLQQEYGIYFTVHLDENLNVSDFNPHIARAYRQTVLETLEFCLTIGAPVINMHLPRGVYFTLPDRKVYLFEEYGEQYLQSLLLFREECGRLAGNAPIKICLENTDGFLPFQKKGIDLLLQSPLFGLTFDTGHNHSIGGTDEPFILDRASSLCHMHLHDASGRNNHLPPGCGEIDMVRCLNLAREHSCRVVLETKTSHALRASVQWLRSRCTPAGQP